MILDLVSLSITRNIFSYKNLSAILNAADTWDVLKSNSETTLHLLHLIIFWLSLGKHSLHAECPHFVNVIGWIMKCLSSDKQHRNS